MIINGRKCEKCIQVFVMLKKMIYLSMVGCRIYGVLFADQIRWENMALLQIKHGGKTNGIITWKTTITHFNEWLVVHNLPKYNIISIASIQVIYWYQFYELNSFCLSFITKMILSFLSKPVTLASYIQDRSQTTTKKSSWFQTQWQKSWKM